MKYRNFNKAIALTLFLVTIGLAFWTFANLDFIGNRIDGNIFSLLPKSERNPVAEEFVSRIAKAGEKSAVILIGSSNLDTALAAEKDFKNQIKNLDLKSLSLEGGLAEYIALLDRHQSGLITSQDIALLQEKSAGFWYDRSNALAYSPSSIGTPWKEDPFGLLGNWINRLAGNTKIYPQGDSLIVSQDSVTYAVVSLETNNFLESIQAQTILADAINLAIENTKNKFQDIRVLRSGVIFIASDTSKTAQRDISVIGLISAICALLLVASIFRSFYAIAVVLTTVAIAFLYAFLTCFFIFPKVYVLTLAFGMSLIGMSVDYCLYWLTGSIDDPKDPFERRRYLLPGMFLALATTVSGYLLLVMTPFPVLSQMAVFSVSGIVVAWVTVIFLFPYVSELRFSGNKYNSLPQFIQPGFLGDFPVLRNFFVSVIVLVSLYGVFAFKVNDDIRSLASFNKSLVNEQLAASNILDIPSPSQFFVVTGSSESEVLGQTEALTKKLDALISVGVITGYRAITQYVPSVDSQNNASKAYLSPNKAQALKWVSKEMELGDVWVKNENQISLPITLADVSQLSIYKRLSYLWFDSSPSVRSTAVLLMGVKGRESVERLSSLASPGVDWIDKPEEISNIFHRYRALFSWVILAGYILTFIGIYIKYKLDSWRAVVPPIFATFITLAILTLMGESIGLLSIIAFALLLGVGTDYGIFLLQYPTDRRILFSISIAALMTLISFGSLSFSSVPALHSFGLTLLIGIFLSWLLTLFFAKRPASNV